MVNKILLLPLYIPLKVLQLLGLGFWYIMETIFNISDRIMDIYE
jgi:hypothetical protein